MNCTRKHTLVTGASSGIGRATALPLAAAGQHVYAGVRREADGAQLARAATGGEITPVRLDVTVASQIAEAAAMIGGHATAGLDGLVNNAGTAWPARPSWSRWTRSGGSWTSTSPGSSR